MSVDTNRRCAFCRLPPLEGLGWRARLAEHLFLTHPESVRGEVRNFLEEAFEALELRATQRALLLFAIDNPQFRTESGRDSTSLWSMARRRWFTVSADQQLQERVWSLTHLGFEVARAALSRARKLGERPRHPVLVNRFASRAARTGSYA